MKKYFLPQTEEGLRAWLRNFATKIGGVATKYVITPAEVTDIQNAANDYEAILDFANAVDAYKQTVSKVKTEMRDGLPAGATPTVLGAMPVVPVLAIAPGIVPGVTSIANRIKGSMQYTQADGENLGLEGAVVSVNYETAQPKITSVKAYADKVVLKWTKARMEGVIVSRSRDGVTWNEIDKDFNSPWEDFASNATAEAEWRFYRLRYLKNGKPVGLVSDVVSVLVSIHTSPTP